ncbi:unnamed protein product [[Actinomadura] parvosata subsp. kistnae]|nr:unnamed protein product [Actinomadura parvosata subsp. kistnae]
MLTVQAGDELARRAAARAVVAAQMRERAAEGARRAANALATLRQRQASLAERGWLPGRDNVAAVVERYEAARRRYDAREHTLINRALGILMAQQRCSPERALQTMHARAHRQGCDLPQIAIELIGSISSQSPSSVHVQHSPAR